MNKNDARLFHLFAALSVFFSRRNPLSSLEIIRKKDDHQRTEINFPRDAELNRFIKIMGSLAK